MPTVTKFRAGWNPQQNRGRIRFGSDDGRTMNLDLDNPAEFTAILTILSSSEEVTFEDGILSTGTEDVG